MRLGGVQLLSLHPTDSLAGEHLGRVNRTQCKVKTCYGMQRCSLVPALVRVFILNRERIAKQEMRVPDVNTKRPYVCDRVSECRQS